MGGGAEFTQFKQNFMFENNFSSISSIYKHEYKKMEKFWILSEGKSWFYIYRLKYFFEY